MKTVQMRLDINLVAQVDGVVRQLGMTRTAFIRDALLAALERIREKEKEDRHRAGYIQKPVKPGEFSDWEEEQVWVDL